MGKEEKKLGIHATACTELSFTDCEVPVANRIGNEGEGYKIALSTLDGGRIGIAAQATGIAQGAFEQALAYAQQRQAFGHPIADFQAIQFMLADMATEIDAARLLVRKAAWKQDTGARFSMEASIAKLFASETGHARRRTKRCRFTAATATAANIRTLGLAVLVIIGATAFLIEHFKATVTILVLSGFLLVVSSFAGMLLVWSLARNRVYFAFVGRDT